MTTSETNRKNIGMPAFVAFVVTSLLTGYLSGAEAQTASTPLVRDAQTCFKVSDSMRLKGITGLENTILGDVSGCQTSLKAKYLCVSGRGNSDQAYTPPSIGSLTTGLVGSVCYRTKKCTANTPSKTTVMDGFGRRGLRVRSPSLFCTSAELGDPYDVSFFISQSVADLTALSFTVDTSSADGFFLRDDTGKPECSLAPIAAEAILAASVWQDEISVSLLSTNVPIQPTPGVILTCRFLALSETVPINGDFTVTFSDIVDSSGTVIPGASIGAGVTPSM